MTQPSDVRSSEPIAGSARIDANEPPASGDALTAAESSPSTLRVVLRYAAFQLPELAIVACVLAVGTEWGWLTAGTALLVFLLWIAKDVVLFPFLRSAYAPRVGPSLHDVRGSFGIAPEGLDGEAYVRIGAERWRARRAAGSAPIAAGDAIRVLALDGLTLVVEGCVEGCMGGDDGEPGSRSRQAP